MIDAIRKCTEYVKIVTNVGSQIEELYAERSASPLRRDHQNSISIKKSSSQGVNLHEEEFIRRTVNKTGRNGMSSALQTATTLVSLQLCGASSASTKIPICQCCRSEINGKLMLDLKYNSKSAEVKCK
nr:unnamed protein product [Callosobruchus analis]